MSFSLCQVLGGAGKLEGHHITQKLSCGGAEYAIRPTSITLCKNCRDHHIECSVSPAAAGMAPLHITTESQGDQSMTTVTKTRYQEIEDNEGKRSELRKKLNALTAKERLSEGDQSAVDALLTELSEKETRVPGRAGFTQGRTENRGRRRSEIARLVRGRRRRSCRVPRALLRDSTLSSYLNVKRLRASGAFRRAGRAERGAESCCGGVGPSLAACFVRPESFPLENRLSAHAAGWSKRATGIRPIPDNLEGGVRAAADGLQRLVWSRTSCDAARRPYHFRECPSPRAFQQVPRY